MPSKRFAAIDIGSNTFRLLIAQAHLPTGKQHPTPWNIIAYTHRIIRLGEGLHQSGRLCEAAMARASQAFHEFSDILNQHHIETSAVTALATSAMREASNGQGFCQQVLTETGINIQIIDGEREANTSLAGSCAVLKESIQVDMLLFDIGGGSTEFIRAKHSQSLHTISRKSGVVRLVETYLHHNPPSLNDYQAMKQDSLNHLLAVEKSWLEHAIQKQPPKYLVGTAGTVTTLAAIDLKLTDYDANRINNHCISKQRFFVLRDQLLAMTHAQRQAIPAIEKGRADLMIAGLAIIENLFEYWHYQELIIVDAGLLEGAWLKLAQRSN